MPHIVHLSTVPKFIFFGILNFALGVLNLIFAKILRQHPTIERILFLYLFLCRIHCFWVTCCLEGLCFIHFGATEKDLKRTSR